MIADLDVSGSAYVIDGDTLRIGDERIRLHGIDAPELRQTCGPLACGAESRARLVAIIGRRPVNCTGRSRDRYRRIIATCRVAGRDIAGALVGEGWALAYVRYSRDYLTEETRARRQRLGMWTTEFVPPEDWRRGRR
ncbi:thermonuclease family protein [Brevundimonas sp. 2R-24]|uniref:Thermonuclease family protein n=1 Tax=Peiella sedimenti TaxID=3061083 RepID=A0ABT8SNH5_9CAUL|nr:thermonuclease family protein [Caulobacteraceae bacterium XZ-24]